ncbi:hypothetical protein [Tuberibacillus sp. Marseille-P3662]|nr:hypothetical protein [Tuberibacillus sp. Marseille-P3662]
MEQMLLLVALTNLATAGINLAVAILKYRDRKKPSPGSSEKASDQQRD